MVFMHVLVEWSPPCKLSWAFGPRNSMKIAQFRVIIQNGWEWRGRLDIGALKAECKFDPERARLSE